MAEASFEGRLERMFAETPAMRDADLFTLQVVDKLDRGWTARRLLIGVMGAAGGVIGSAQILGSGVIGHIQALSAQSNAYLLQHVSQAIPQGLLPAGVALNGQVIWMAAALAVVAAGLGLARGIREI
jgi:hypothetical protein